MVDEQPAYPADLALARACIAGDATAIRQFDRDVFARVNRVLARLGLSAADAEDVKQEVRTKLLLGDSPKLAQFAGTGPLAHWVASVAGREGLGLMRKRKPLDPIGDDDDLLVDTSDDPQLIALKDQHSSDFKRAFQAAVAELPPRDRGVLRAMILEDRTINEIAAVYGVHRVTASRWVSEIRHALLSRTRANLRQHLSLDESGVDSAIRLIDTNLELSLYRLLGDAA